MVRSVPCCCKTKTCNLSTFSGTVAVAFRDNRPKSHPAVIGIDPQRPGVAVSGRLRALLVNGSDVVPVSVPCSSRLVLRKNVPTRHSGCRMQFDTAGPPLRMTVLLRGRLGGQNVAVSKRPAMRGSSLPSRGHAALRAFRSPHLHSITRLAGLGDGGRCTRRVFHFLNATTRPCGTASGYTTMLIDGR